MESHRALLALLLLIAASSAHFIRDSKNDSISGQGEGCQYNGTWFAEGEELPTRGLCLICHCFQGFLEPNAFTCNVIDCPWEDYHKRFPGCTPIYADRDCCPIGWECDYGTGQSQELTKQGCDCEWRYLKHYEAKGCRPVYEEKPREEKCTCPWRFDCSQTDDLPADDRVCQYKKHVYPVGSRIPTSNTCESCTCATDYFTQAATIQCTTTECPAVYSKTPLPPGCHYVYKEGQCCPESLQCPTNPQDDEYRVPSCEYRGKMYYEGEQIYPEEDPCLICLCDQNWNGLNSSSCRQHDCMLERDARRLKQGCIPIYHEKTCCPIDYHCAEADDDLDFKSNRAPSFKSDDDEDEMCFFENRYYPIGHVLDIKHPTNCVTCTCKTPPDFTCIHSSCPPPPNNDYTHCKAVYKPHACCPDYTCEDKTSGGACPDPICNGTNCWLVKRARDGCSVCRCKSRCVPCPSVCRPENPLNECSGCICQINETSILQFENQNKVEKSKEADSVQQLVQKCKEMQCPSNQRCMLVEKPCSEGESCNPVPQCENISFGCGQPKCPEGCEVIGTYENDCPICHCKEKLQVSQYKLTCRVQSCEENCILSGRDEDGCPVCKCPQGNLEERICAASECTGYNCTMVIDNLGCAACSCQLPCKPRECPVGCDLDLDIPVSSGLECGCTCKNSTTAVALMRSKAIPENCSPAWCEGLNCTVFVDRSGCPVCSCKASCPTPVCQEGCRVEVEVSEAGRCPGCVCKLSRSARDNTGKECPPPTCQGYNCSVITGEEGCQKCFCESPCEETPQCPSHCKLETNVPQGRCRGCVCSYGEHTTEPSTTTTPEEDLELEKREDLEADFIPLPGKELVPGVDKIFLIHGDDKEGEFAGMPGYHYQGGHAYPVFGEPLESVLYNVDDIIPGEMESSVVREDEDVDYDPEMAEEKTLDDVDNSKCAQKNCPEGQKCVLRRLQCIRTPCPTIPVCIDVEPRCPIPMCAIGCMVMKWDDEVCPSCFCGIIRGAEGRVCPRTRCAGRRCYNVIGDDGCPQCKCDSICIPPKCKDGCEIEKDVSDGKCPTCICSDRSTVLQPIIPGTSPTIDAATIDPATTNKNDDLETVVDVNEKEKDKTEETKLKEEKGTSAKAQESFDLHSVAAAGHGILELDAADFYDSLADIQEEAKSEELTTVTVNLPTTINAQDIFDTSTISVKESESYTVEDFSTRAHYSDDIATTISPPEKVSKPCLLGPDSSKLDNSELLYGETASQVETKIPLSSSSEKDMTEISFSDTQTKPANLHSSSVSSTFNADSSAVEDTYPTKHVENEKNAGFESTELTNKPQISTGKQPQQELPKSPAVFIENEHYENGNMQPILQNLQQLVSNLHQVLSNHQTQNTPDIQTFKSNFSLQESTTNHPFATSVQQNESNLDNNPSDNNPMNTQLKPSNIENYQNEKNIFTQAQTATDLQNGGSNLNQNILPNSELPNGVTSTQSISSQVGQSTFVSQSDVPSNQNVITNMLQPGANSNFQLYHQYPFQNSPPTMQFLNGAPQVPFQTHLQSFYPIPSTFQGSIQHNTLYRPQVQQQSFMPNEQFSFQHDPNLSSLHKQSVLTTNIPIPPSLQQQLNAGTQTLGFLQHLLNQVSNPFYQQQLYQSNIQSQQQLNSNNNIPQQWNLQENVNKSSSSQNETKDTQVNQSTQEQYFNLGNQQQVDKDQLGIQQTSSSSVPNVANQNHPIFSAQSSQTTSTQIQENSFTQSQDTLHQKEFMNTSILNDKNTLPQNTFAIVPEQHYDNSQSDIYDPNSDPTSLASPSSDKGSQTEMSILQQFNHHAPQSVQTQQSLVSTIQAQDPYQQALDTSQSIQVPPTQNAYIQGQHSMETTNIKPDLSNNPQAEQNSYIQSLQPENGILQQSISAQTSGIDSNQYTLSNNQAILLAQEKPIVLNQEASETHQILNSHNYNTQSSTESEKFNVQTNKPYVNNQHTQTSTQYDIHKMPQTGQDYIFHQHPSSQNVTPDKLIQQQQTQLQNAHLQQHSPNNLNTASQINLSSPPVNYPAGSGNLLQQSQNSGIFHNNQHIITSSNIYNPNSEKHQFEIQNNAFAANTQQVVPAQPTTHHHDTQLQQQYSQTQQHAQAQQHYIRPQGSILSGISSGQQQHHLNTNFRPSAHQELLNQENAFIQNVQSSQIPHQHFNEAHLQQGAPQQQHLLGVGTGPVLMQQQHTQFHQIAVPTNSVSQSSTSNPHFGVNSVPHVQTAFQQSNQANHISLNQPSEPQYLIQQHSNQFHQQYVHQHTSSPLNTKPLNPTSQQTLIQQQFSGPVVGLPTSQVQVQQQHFNSHNRTTSEIHLTQAQQDLLNANEKPTVQVFGTPFQQHVSNEKPFLLQQNPPQILSNPYQTEQVHYEPIKPQINSQINSQQQESFPTNSQEHIQYQVSEDTSNDQPDSHIQQYLENSDITSNQAPNLQEHIDPDMQSVQNQYQQTEEKQTSEQPLYEIASDDQPHTLQVHTQEDESLPTVNENYEHPQHEVPASGNIDQNVAKDQLSQSSVQQSSPAFVHQQSIKTRPGVVVRPHFPLLGAPSSTTSPEHDLFPVPSRPVNKKPSLQQQEEWIDPQFDEEAPQESDYEDFEWDDPEPNEEIVTHSPEHVSLSTAGSSVQQEVFENFDNHQPDISKKPLNQQQEYDPDSSQKQFFNRYTTTSKIPFTTKTSNIFASLSTVSPTAEVYGGGSKYPTHESPYQCPTPHCNGYNCSLIRGSDGCQKCVCDSPCAPCPQHCVKTKTLSEGRCPICDCTQAPIVESGKGCPPVSDCYGSNCRKVKRNDGCLTCVCDPKCADPKCDPGCEVLRDVPPGQCPGCVCRVTVVQAVVQRPLSCPKISCVGKHCSERRGPDGCLVCSCPSAPCSLPKCGPGCTIQTDVPDGQCPTCVCATFTDDDEDEEEDDDLYCPNLFCSEYGCREIPGPAGCPICSCDQPICQDVNCDPGCEVVSNKYHGKCPVCICSHPVNTSSDSFSEGGIKNGNISQSPFTGIVEAVVAEEEEEEEEESTLSTLHTTVTVDLGEMEETVTVAETTTTTEAPTTQCPAPVCSGLRCSTEIGDNGCEVCKCRYKCPTPKCVGNCYAETNAPSHRCPGCVCPSKPKPPKY